MIARKQPMIIRQAFLPLVTLSILALIVHYQWGFTYAAGLWCAVAVTGVFFRDPKRQIPPVPLAIVAPVDGKVVSIDQVFDPYLNRSAIRIQMSGSLLGVYTVRSVMEGKIQKQWFGTLPEGSEEGIYSSTKIPDYSQWTQSDECDDVVTTLSPRVLSKGVSCTLSAGERIGQGKPCSFVAFGTDAEVLLAESSRVEVKPGDRILAGSSIIATLIH